MAEWLEDLRLGFQEVMEDYKYPVRIGLIRPIWV